MLPKILLGSLMVLVLLAGCKPSPEQMLVGTWRIQGLNAGGAWTYHADHALEFHGYDGRAACRRAALGEFRAINSPLTREIRRDTRAFPTLQSPS